MGNAIFSDCGKYRYRLERHLGTGQTVLGIMVNPSLATSNTDDPTIRRFGNFARHHGWGKLIIVNKFAYITPHIAKLAKVSDPIGCDNDRHIAQAVLEADLCVVAWGTLNKLPRGLVRERWRAVLEVVEKAGMPALCWGTNLDGHPKHPLYLPKDVNLIEWRAPT